MITPSTMSFNAKEVKVYLAGAGCGKTTALMGEMTELLKVYRPEEIAFVTYTKKGVAHGRERALLACPELSNEDLIHFRTLHSLCFRELGLASHNILSKKDMEEFNKLLGFNVTLAEGYENQTDDDKLLIRYDALRSGSTKLTYTCGKYDESRYKRLINAYEAFKKKTGTLDFYDCLLRFRERNKPVSVKIAFIDEAQDLTLLQWEVCKIAFSKCEKVFIAGDDSQTLFSYQGASPETLINLAGKYETVKHEKSYRLPEEVYRFSKGITGIIIDKVEKDFRPVKKDKGFVRDVGSRNFLGPVVLHDIKANGMTPYRWYFLFRNNCFMSETIDTLEGLMIPFHTPKGFCLDIRKLGKIKRYYNLRKKGFASPEAVEQFCKQYKINDINNDDFTDSELLPEAKKYIYYAYVEKFGIDALIEMAEKEPFLLLSTVHKVKGGEADFVAVFLDCTRKVFENLTNDYDEELRVLYVACSRARNGLYLVQSKTKYGLDRVIDLVKEQVA